MGQLQLVVRFELVLRMKVSSQMLQTLSAEQAKQLETVQL